MISQRHLFLQHQAQTSPFPLMLEIVKAEGVFMYDLLGKRYMDLISGISVSNVGHCHPAVVSAIQEQASKYMHLMVYGEYIQSPQVQLSKALADILPRELNCTYLVNSGAEAIEGAMKLAKRYTGKTEFISFRNAYHGSTQGALSIMGDEQFKNAYRPLLPHTRILDYNDFESIELIGSNTAAVFVEMIQGEAGALNPLPGFIFALRKKCYEVGALLIADEIQTGFGRTGKMFAFEHFNIVPDVITVAKGMGGGMPIGAFISSTALMKSLTENPILGHLTTFGGNAVCCAAALASLRVIQNEKLLDSVAEKELIFRENLVHHRIKKIYGLGLLLAIEFESSAFNFAVIALCMQKGLVTDWFLFSSHKMRIAPPLQITEEQILWACQVILECIQLVDASNSF